MTKLKTLTGAAIMALVLPLAFSSESSAQGRSEKMGGSGGATVGVGSDTQGGGARTQVRGNAQVGSGNTEFRGGKAGFSADGRATVSGRERFSGNAQFDGGARFNRSGRYGRVGVRSTGFASDTTFGTTGYRTAGWDGGWNRNYRYSRRGYYPGASFAVGFGDPYYYDSYAYYGGPGYYNSGYYDGGWYGNGGVAVGFNNGCTCNRTRAAWR